jgi:serine/threonine protein kinase
MPPSLELAPGSLFAGDYRIVRPLSEGGMGAVYVVDQLSTGNQRALKLMHRELVQSPDLRRRFEQEARVGARIESEHVVQVLAAGVDASSGMPWLVMELLQGEDLAAALRRTGAMRPEQVIAIMSQLCHALAAAHRAGVVHRDLKPENIFLAASRRADVPFTVKVLDFGIAKVVAEAQTMNTGAVGTPLYMAPEQTAPGQAIAPATDVWALGLIAFRLLTGLHFWRGANNENTSAVMILREVVMDPIPPASVRASELGTHHALPVGFDAWFARATHRDPRARFADAGEALGALAAALGLAGSVASAATAQEPVSPRLGAATAQEPVSPRLGAADPVSPFAATATPASAGAATGPTPGGVVLDDDPELERLARSVSRSGRSALPWVFAGLGLLGVVAIGVGWLVWRPSSDNGSAAAAPARGVCPRDMVYVEAGSYWLGDIKRLARVAAFCMDITEVTAGAYSRCVRRRACSDERVTSCPEATYDVPDRQFYPMNCVDFRQADAFCQARGRRLPTEDEWEWVARGGKMAFAYPWGNDAPADQLCWSGKNKRSSPCPVGEFDEGDTTDHVRDLAGGVLEWTQSFYKEGQEFRVYRGTSWADVEPAAVRAASRHQAAPTKRGELLGFRCVMDPERVRAK